jgi:glutathione reductase (NADPH)
MAEERRPFLCQSVIKKSSRLQLIFLAAWKPVSRLGKYRAMAERFCCARSMARLTCSAAWRPASLTGGRRCWLAALAGSQVTVLHRGPRPLALFDPDLVDQLVERTRELGIDLHLETEATGIEKSSAQLIVQAMASGEKRTFQTDMVVHSAGRVPEISDLNLDAAGIEWEKRRVRVNDFLQSVSIPAVYAAGDAAASGGLPLASVASYEGLVVAANLLKGNHQKPNYLGIPSVVFTVPPLAAVGLNERGEREQNLKFRVNMEMTSTWYSSRRVAETYSGYKVLVEESTDNILGAHILGSEAGEVINLFALAIRSGMRATDLKHTLFAYPTSGSNMARML